MRWLPGETAHFLTDYHEPTRYCLFKLTYDVLEPVALTVRCISIVPPTMLEQLFVPSPSAEAVYVYSTLNWRSSIDTSYFNFNSTVVIAGPSF